MVRGWGVASVELFLKKMTDFSESIKHKIIIFGVASLLLHVIDSNIKHEYEIL